MSTDDIEQTRDHALARVVCEILHRFRDEDLTEDELVDAISAFSWSVRTDVGTQRRIPLDAAWDIVEGGLSARRDLLLRARDRVAAGRTDGSRDAENPTGQSRHRRGIPT